MPETAEQHPLSSAPTERKFVEPHTPDDDAREREVLEFFDICERNRELLCDVYVEIPVRPADGMNCVLHRMAAIWYGQGIAFNDLSDNMGGFIEVTRANMAKKFLDDPPLNAVTGKPCNYLLMLDNDMEPTVQLPYLLARHQKGVVGGCAMSVDSTFGPQLCFTIKDNTGKYRFPSFAAGQPIPARGLIEVGHVGTGALMIRRDVLEQFSFDGDDCPFFVPHEYRMRGMRTGTMNMGEDIAFCNQLRAKGVPMYVDLEAHVGHRKSMCLTWDTLAPKQLERDPFLDASKWVLPEIGKEIVSR